MRTWQHNYYLDAKYPKNFCIDNPVLVSANGCQKFKSEICATDISLAQSSTCAGH